MIDPVSAAPPYPDYYDCDRCGEDTCVESWGDDGTRYLACGECGALYDVQPPAEHEQGHR